MDAFIRALWANGFGRLFLAASLVLCGVYAAFQAVRTGTEPPSSRLLYDRSEYPPEHVWLYRLAWAVTAAQVVGVIGLLITSS